MAFRYQTPPTLRFTGSAPWISAEVRIGGWSSMRRLIDMSRCKCAEKRIGFITKKFTVTGSEEQMRSFMVLAWNDEVIGPTLREEVANGRT